ncbi:MAG: hypothetical protein JSR34_04550 [Proteobacteria bacterium]|nr:hypothetical protein [Pseudomonadota bacterium]
MSQPRIIHYAGSREADAAYLRMLLASAKAQLGQDWAWGQATDADLLLTDGASIEGAASRPASKIGSVVAEIIDVGDPVPAGPFLARPLRSSSLAALLNEVTRKYGGPPITGSPVTPPPRSAPPKVYADTPVVASESAAEDPNTMRPLLHYLPKRVLGGSAQIAMEGAPPLTIDPESRLFWAAGPLTALEPYLREPLRLGDWKRLSDHDLEALREGSPGRLCACLVWMDAYLLSKGVLSRRLDPDGVFCLTKRLDLANDYPRALLISVQMSHPRKLDAIARLSGADIAEVHDVVNAYDAIGYLETTRSTAKL